jgi:GxxExxY protein
MPVHVGATTRRVDNSEFSNIAYGAMRHVFAIHNELGRFFDEKIYKREFGARCPKAQLEVPLDISFEGFSKRYFLDALVAGAAIFEFKAVESLTVRHRAQLMHYLLASEMPHGRLVNMRTMQVQHEFVNAHLKLQQRTAFTVINHDWRELSPQPLQDWCVALLRDLGACLEVNLYEEALTYWLGGEEQVQRDIGVLCNNRNLGLQKFRLAAPFVAFKITALPSDGFDAYEAHIRRLLEHTALQAIQWINVTLEEVRFRTIRK